MKWGFVRPHTTIARLPRTNDVIQSFQRTQLFTQPLLNDGSTFLFTPFFIDILDFYHLAPAQLNPMAWCHMMATLMLYDR